METRLVRGAALAATLAVLLGTTCNPVPLTPWPGLAAWRQPASFGVRDGVVDLAGGNLLLLRTDLTIETRLGTQAVTHVYNSATDRWTWSFEMRLADGLFEDDTGARHAVTGTPGPLAGTHWRVVDAATIESRGGLRFSFAPDGSLARIAWRQASYPRLELRRPGDGTLHLVQCTAADACADVYVVHYAGGQVASIVDRAGRTYEYGHASGRLAWVRGALEREQGLPPRRYDYTLGANGRPLAVVVTNPEQERARYELDAVGRVTAWALLGEGSPRWQLEHLAPARTLLTDPLGHTTELRFDNSRRLLEIHGLAVGERTTFAWSGRRVTRVVGPDGLAATARYDAADELVESVLPSGRRIELEYVPGAVNLADPWTALPSRVLDAGTERLARTFDAQGRLASEANGAGERTRFVYGPLETLARVELPSGLTVHFAEYGEHGQPAEVRVPAADPDQPDYLERREFDAVGNLTRGADPGSESGLQFPGVVARRFDAARRVRVLVMSQSLRGEVQDVVLVRRSDGQLRSVQRPYGADAEYDYDAIGRLRVRRDRVDGAWAATRFAWTPLGQPARTELANGMTEELVWDAAGRLAQRTNRRGNTVESTVRYAYAAGRLVRRDDSSVPGSTTHVAYDARGLPSRVTWPGGEQSVYGYDGRERLTSVALLDADGRLLRQLGLRYDAAGREARLLDGAAVVYEQVHAGGRLSELRHGNGIVRTLSYDPFGRPSGAVSRDAAGGVVERESVVHQGRSLAGPDPNGPFREVHARYEATAPFGPVAFSERAVGFRYVDGQRWLAGFGDSGTVYWCNGAQCGDPELTWFVHSGLMDLEQEVLPSTDARVRHERVFATNPERNRLHEVLLRTTTLPDGPCSTCEPDTEEQLEHRYTWDAAGFATSRDGMPISWDATGRPAAVGDALFVHDGEGRLRAWVVGGEVRQRRFGGLVEADALGRPQQIDLGVVAIDLVAGRRSYRHFDWRGNVRSLWSDGGELLAVREYGAYGLDRLHGEGADDPRGFAQGIEAGELALLGARLYDAAARRFLSPDPVYSAFHQHVYGAGDPVHYWDWTGRRAEETVGFKVAGAIGEGLGFSGGLLLGAAAGARTKTPGAALALAGLFAMKGAEGTRGWVELLYSLLYDWFTSKPEPPGGGAWGGDAPLGGFVTPPPISGPMQPMPVCTGECYISWDGSTGRGRLPPISRGGGGGGGGAPGGSFSFPAVSVCGLLGIEPLLVLALVAHRRRRLRR